MAMLSRIVRCSHCKHGIDAGNCQANVSMILTISLVITWFHEHPQKKTPDSTLVFAGKVLRDEDWHYD